MKNNNMLLYLRAHQRITRDTVQISQEQLKIDSFHLKNTKFSSKSLWFPMIWKLSKEAKAKQSKVDFWEISKNPKQSKVAFQTLQIRGKSKAKQSEAKQNGSPA